MRYLVVCALGTALIFGQAKGGEFAALLEQLQHPSTTNRARSEIEAIARASQGARNSLSVSLPMMLVKASSPDVLVSEAGIAGEFKVESTLPALCSLLDQPNKIRESTTMTSRYELHDDPVGHALFEMGDKAVPCLSSDPLVSSHTLTRARAMAVLLRIGTPASRSALQHHLPYERDDMLRKYLVANGITDSPR